MIYIITPCSRPENLNQISQTIPSECKWIVVHDGKKPIVPPVNATLLLCEDTGLVGTVARNYALDTLPLTDDDFVLFHDDDNIIHPRWHTEICKYLNEDFSMITWGQVDKNLNIRLPPTAQPRIDHIDTASFLISWKYNKNVRHESVYHHDGIYAEACSKNGKVLCLNDHLCYYNYLR